MLRRRPNGTWEFLHVEQTLVSGRPAPLSLARKDALRLRIMSELGAQDAPGSLWPSLAPVRWVAIPAGVGLAAAIIASTQVLPRDDAPDQSPAVTYAYSTGSILVDGKVAYRAAPGDIVQTPSSAWLAVGNDVEVGLQTSSSVRYYQQADRVRLQHLAGDLVVASTGRPVTIEGAAYAASAGQGTVAKFARLGGGTWVEVAEGTLVLQVGDESMVLSAGDTYFIADSPGASGDGEDGGSSNPGHGPGGNGGGNDPAPGNSAEAPGHANDDDDASPPGNGPATNNGNGNGASNGNGPGGKNDPLADDAPPPAATPPRANPTPGVPPAHSNAGGSSTSTPAPPPPVTTPVPPVVTPAGPPATPPGEANTPPERTATPGPPPHANTGEDDPPPTPPATPEATPTPPPATPTATPPSNNGNAPPHSNAGGNGVANTGELPANAGNQTNNGNSGNAPPENSNAGGNGKAKA